MKILSFVIKILSYIQKDNNNKWYATTQLMSWLFNWEGFTIK